LKRWHFQEKLINQPVYGPTGGAMKSDVNAPGPIYLHGDHGKVEYRNIVLTPIVKKSFAVNS
jgi:hypothetical protein